MQYLITYRDHDMGSAADGRMIREPLARAELTADLLRQCGYRAVTIKPYVSVKAAAQQSIRELFEV